MNDEKLKQVQEWQWEEGLAMIAYLQGFLP